MLKRLIIVLLVLTSLSTSVASAELIDDPWERFRKIPIPSLGGVTYALGNYEIYCKAKAYSPHVINNVLGKSYVFGRTEMRCWVRFHPIPGGAVTVSRWVSAPMPKISVSSCISQYIGPQHGILIARHCEGDVSLPGASTLDAIPHLECRQVRGDDANYGTHFQTEGIVTVIYPSGREQRTRTTLINERVTSLGGLGQRSDSAVLFGLVSCKPPPVSKR